MDIKDSKNLLLEAIKRITESGISYEVLTSSEFSQNPDYLAFKACTTACSVDKIEFIVKCLNETMRHTMEPYDMCGEDIKCPESAR